MPTIKVKVPNWNLSLIIDVFLCLKHPLRASLRKSGKIMFPSVVSAQKNRNTISIQILIFDEVRKNEKLMHNHAQYPHSCFSFIVFNNFFKNISFIFYYYIDIFFTTHIQYREGFQME